MADAPVVHANANVATVSGSTMGCFPDVAPYEGYSDECLSRRAAEATGAGGDTMFIMVTLVLVCYSVFFTLVLYACLFRPSGINSRFVQFDLEPGQKPASGPAPETIVRMASTAVPAQLEKQWRLAFIGKVYSILGIQMFATVVISFLMMQYGGADLVLWSYTAGSWSYMATFILTFTTLIALMCFRHKYPHNVFLLSAFTLAMSFMIGLTCTKYAVAGFSALVLEAFAITSILFVGLSVFTMQTKWDFSFVGLAIAAVVFASLVWSLFAMFVFPTFVFRQIFALIGVVVFSLYVVYDTWLISSQLSYDEYVLGAINLYLDFLNLFLCILQCLTGGGQRE